MNPAESARGPARVAVFGGRQGGRTIATTMARTVDRTYLDAVDEFLADCWRGLHQQEAGIVVAGLMATDPDRRHSFRWRPAPGPVATGIVRDGLDAGNELRLWAEMEPPEMWCDLHATPDQPLTVTADGMIVGRFR